ncbi:tyrosine-type recombinase/integrase, partial [Candidatus Omnitrophota bacterium]
MGIYKKKNDYYIDYYANGRRIREKIGSSKTLAENVLRKRKLAIAENRFLDVRKQHKIKLVDFIDTYLELHSKPHKRSYKTDVCNAKHIKRFFRGKYLYEITSMLVEKFKIERAEQSSQVSANRQLALLKGIMNKGVEWGKLSSNPITKVKLYKENNHRLRYLEKEEIEKLLRNCRGRLKPIAIVALNTGMRKGEIFSMKWKDVDFARSLINIYHTKNGEKRTVP